MSPPLFIAGMQGLGDNIFQRAVIKELAEGWTIYLATAWPEIYSDLEAVRAVDPRTRLRTQAKNARRPHRWHHPPARCPRMRIGYGANCLERGNIVQAMEKCVGLKDAPLRFDLPRFERPDCIPWDRPVAVVRPVTVRTEWQNEARNPRPEYLAEICERISADYRVVSIADLQHRHEWALDPLPPADIRLHRGELQIEQLLGLVQNAALVIGGVGWIVPAAVATQTPTFVVLGGMGAHNAPEVVLDPRMKAGHIGWGMPDHFCRCRSFTHGCDKRIGDLASQFDRWRSRHGL